MIEINRNAKYTFRINPDDLTEIDCRENKNKSRWKTIARFDTPDEARQALLAIEAKWRQVAQEQEQENVLARRSSQEVSPPSAGQARFEGKS